MKLVDSIREFKENRDERKEVKAILSPDNRNFW